jgi:protein-S-isoprenylcysteine O-methyltransferase Ste14
MNWGESVFNPRRFLVLAGSFLTVLGLVGLLVLNDRSQTFFWLDGSENAAHIVLGVLALLVVYVPAFRQYARPYYRWIVFAFGLIALFFGVYGFLVTGDTSGANTFGVTNLEVGDNLLNLVLATWAFAAYYVAAAGLDRS